MPSSNAPEKPETFSSWFKGLDASVLYMGMNIVSAIAIVFCNKYVLREFNYGTTLTFFHFSITFAGLLICAAFDVFEVKRIPIIQILPLCFAFLGFVVLNNLSIQYNSVGFYQTMKISITPTVCLIEYFLRGKTFAPKIKISLVIVCVGIGIATINDFRVNFVGALYGVGGVLVTALYQIWSGSFQEKLKVNALQLLFYQVPLSMVLILFAIPVFDFWLNKKTATPLWEFDWNLNIILLILLSSVLAFFVNISIFLVIGRTSAVTYNVASHFKTVSILIGGVLLFGDFLSLRTSFGVCVCLGGIFYYSYLKLQEQAAKKTQAAPPAPAPDMEEKASSRV